MEVIRESTSHDGNEALIQQIVRLIRQVHYENITSLLLRLVFLVVYGMMAMFMNFLIFTFLILIL